MGSFTGGILGKVIGASIPVNIRISINGTIEKFEQQKQLMQQYSVKNNR